MVACRCTGTEAELFIQHGMLTAPELLARHGVGVATKTVTIHLQARANTLYNFKRLLQRRSDHLNVAPMPAAATQASITECSLSGDPTAPDALAGPRS